MRFGQLMALAFIDETNKIAGAIHVPINQLQIKEAASLIEGFFEKEAATRAVKEWRKADAAGDTTTANQISQAYGQANLKPRYLQDVSLGGAEAGVDRMMGDVRHATGQMPQQVPEQPLQGRLAQMKANKADMGMAGATPSHVMQSPGARGMLLNGTQPAQPNLGPAPNASGDFARKLYKPDSYITQAEFTPKYLDQKQRMTDAARSLSPEAKQMVPEMYGHATRGEGPTQRSSSFHEFVPGMREMQDGTAATNNTINHVKDTVLNPLALKKNMQMDDVSGMHGTNLGNLVQSPTGPKVVDFKPLIQGEVQHDSRSFMKYAPMPTMRHSPEGGGNLADLRKEQYKPTMQSNEASLDQVAQAIRAHRALQNKPATPQGDPFAAAHDRGQGQGANPFAQGHTEPAPNTIRQSPMRSAVNPLGRTAPAMPQGQAPAQTMNQGPASAVFRQPQPAARPVSSAPAMPTRPVIARPATPAPAMKSPPALPTRPVLPAGGIKPFKLPAVGGMH